MPYDRKPEWLKIRPPSGENYRRIKSLLRERDLHTVCEEAHCPNVHECWGGGTATFMLMGDVCTRGCRFCAVHTGNPRGELDLFEPFKIAQTIADLGLDYVVLTSVDRDDLPDGGASHFARTVRAIKYADPSIIVETLIPDFRGDTEALEALADAGPEVIAHNVETTTRLTPTVRDVRATYDQSLFVLRTLKEFSPGTFTKSSIMVGLGETEEEVRETMEDLREVGVDFLTLGQYLRPTQRHLEVRHYVPPEQFERYRELGEHLGFLYVAAGPLVRSSYRAGEFFTKSVIEARRGLAPATQ